MLLAQQPAVFVVSIKFKNLNFFPGCKLDTAEIAALVRSELKRLKIRQHVFAERILNRTQGTLSTILRKPTPWNLLKSGHEVFWKMNEWLGLPDENKLEISSGPQIKSKTKTDCGKSDSTRIFSNDGKSENIQKDLDQLGSCNVHNYSYGQNITNNLTSRTSKEHRTDDYYESTIITCAEVYERVSNCEQPSSFSKRRRYSFSQMQKEKLSNYFRMNNYASKEAMLIIANEVGVSLTAVKNFFLNSRQRCKNSEV